ncbi:hypothetical protein GCM10011583_13440 [Streptomyces camponoticapitis]|uniref:DUF397 domain-containing protein n=1 Tax=Streptomyces camponoticapitis TaxID=1616125 RepID=A0ABQ2DZZ3_9ACTN|nr:DUF397 domain-containing protein [Streptomyces camponoticapitis]GGJ83099.1 hypothetical protein GCM10011583_13440 [Streptomyces camponoticapitis]
MSDLYVARWKKSSFSEEENCVEIATGSTVLVRDSKRAVMDSHLSFDYGAWRAFVGLCKAGDQS